MARIKLGPLVSDIRGTVDNLTFSIAKTDQHYVRSQTGAIHNPQSIAQGVKRAFVALYSKLWRGALTQAQRDGWDTYALTQPGKGNNDGGVNNMIKGNNGIMSGFNAYLLVNTQLASVGLAAVTDAPLAAPAPTPTLDVAVTFLAGIATVTWTPSVSVEVGAICRIYIRVEGIRGHVQIATVEAFDTATKDVAVVRGANGRNVLFTLLVGKVLHVQMDTVNPTGGKSAGSNVAQATIA